MVSPAPRATWPLALLLVVGLCALPRSAQAQPPSTELMAKLAATAARIDLMRTHASYSVEGRLEGFDGEGDTNSVKEMKARVEADGTHAKVIVLSYVEDGEDKTAEGQKTAKEAADKRRDPEKLLRMPTLGSEQPRYVFDQAETDPLHPERVRITFTPKVPEENTVEGSGWVDTRTGTVITAGFKLSVTPMFVEFVHFTVEFGANTALGQAVSTVNVEGKGGFLFFRRHFRGVANVSGYRIVP
jgi:hypothetical protein